MKHIKSLCYMSVITSLITMVFLGSVYGATVTMQREDALQKGQESAVSKNDAALDGNPLKFSPQKLREKNDSATESGTGSHSVKMERYNPYKEDEGERKIK